MNQTARTFFFVALVVAILMALHFLPKMTIGENELRRVNVLSDIFPDDDDTDTGGIPDVPEPPKPIVIAGGQNGALSTHPEVTPIDSGTVASSSVYHRDSLFEAGPVAVIVNEGDTAAANERTVEVPPVPEGVTAILDYSEGRANGMYSFYQQLSRILQLGRPVRIAYYGDSFIEGDIFTQDLRELLQDQFGGSGVGWVDCASQVHGFRQSVGHSFSGITEYEIVKRPFNNAYQSIAQRYFTATEGARITYKGARARRHQNQWGKAIFYLRSEGGLRLTTTMNGDSTRTDTIAGSPQLQAIECRDSIPMTSVSYTLRGISSGSLLYGVALEPRSGIIVDNFSMRGSAGYNLSQMPAATLSEFAAIRPYDLIVVHYGLNVANSSQTNYSGYTRNMGQAIEHLRQAFPQTSILVVGMPDRDQRSSNGLHTMKGVEALVAYQQIMASEHGVSFFNLFEAMGGRDSMKDLVDQGMANKDYTHINFKGGRHLARFLFDAIMAGYHSYGF